MRAGVAPGDLRDWVSFEDPDEDRTWLFDVTFLAGSWRCCYGDGCEGVLRVAAPALQQGCCSYGAHLSGPEDESRVEQAAEQLGAELWQYAARARRRRGGVPAGVLRRAAGAPTTTRLVDGACIFLNRPGFAAGAGCALHLAALHDGVPPLRYKPDVCWQLPLRREDEVEASGHVVSRVTQWQRRHWGPAGEEFAWWCSDAPAAFGDPEPVYRRLALELEALCGTKVAARLSDVLGARLADRGLGSRAPGGHPRGAKQRATPAATERLALSSTRRGRAS